MNIVLMIDKPETWKTRLNPAESLKATTELQRFIPAQNG